MKVYVDDSIGFPSDIKPSKCTTHSHRIIVSVDRHGISTEAIYFKGASCHNRCTGRVLSDIKEY